MRLAQRHGLDTETRRHDRGDREVQNTEILQYHKLPECFTIFAVL